MTLRMKLIWSKLPVKLAVFAISLSAWMLLCFFAVHLFMSKVEGATLLPPVPSVIKKSVRKSAEVTQGAGALALVAKSKVVVPVRQPATFFFAATALAPNGLESDYSGEVSFSTTNCRSTVTLAWEPSMGWSGPFPLTYNLYTGRASRSYSSVASAGTNLLLAVSLAPKLVICVTGLGTNFCLTNPTGPWMLWKGTNMTISARWI